MESGERKAESPEVKVLDDEEQQVTLGCCQLFIRHTSTRPDLQGTAELSMVGGGLSASLELTPQDLRKFAHCLVHFALKIDQRLRDHENTKAMQDLGERTLSPEASKLLDWLKVREPLLQGEAIVLNPHTLEQTFGFGRTAIEAALFELVGRGISRAEHGLGGYAIWFEVTPAAAQRGAS